ncbi:hypothetical protein NKW85_01385 [Staphylococcus simulans]|uniref:Uncharacterized protein n=1 Tax=Staphylococcus simulans UMC-CNS-990 TaxID=1405498 RepID=A0ABN0PD56_STASI|nr:hypothetical protein [Staphylococcus simulans]ERS93502.1 hypothetical protein SSIM_07295 [Staphylococcus simulans UMC-CNS-990]MCE5148148.1 hypothetical protein [Staphylococcus simulans]PTJ34943.1 hypothetical protein BU026_00230 [Staphylococcus simulans]
MIQIILYLTIGLLFTLLDLILIRRNRRILVCLSTFVFYTLFINGFIIGLLLLILGKPNALKTNMYHTFFAIEYGVLASGIGIALLVVHAILMHRLTFTAVPGRRAWLTTLNACTLLLLMFLGSFLIKFTDWWFDLFGETKPQDFISKIQSLIQLSDRMILPGLIQMVLISSIFYTLIVLFMIYFNRFNFIWNAKTKAITIMKRSWIQTALFAVTLAVFISGLIYSVYHLHLIDVCLTLLKK